MSSEYLNSQYKNKIEYTSTVASSTSVGGEENSDVSIMPNNSNATANYVLSSSDLISSCSRSKYTLLKPLESKNILFNGLKLKSHK